MCISLLLFIFSIFSIGILNIRNLSDWFMTKDLKKLVHALWPNDKKKEEYFYFSMLMQLENLLK